MKKLLAGLTVLALGAFSAGQFAAAADWTDFLGGGDSSVRVFVDNNNSATVNNIGTNNVATGGNTVDTNGGSGNSRSLGLIMTGMGSADTEMLTGANEMNTQLDIMGGCGCGDMTGDSLVKVSVDNNNSATVNNSATNNVSTGGNTVTSSNSGSHHHNDSGSTRTAGVIVTGDANSTIGMGTVVNSSTTMITVH